MVYPCVHPRVIGGIYSGLTIATEAAAFGASCALVIAWLRSGLTAEDFHQSIVDTLHSGLPQFMGGLVATMDLGLYGVIFFMVIIYLILGCFLDPIGIILITLPILLPMWKAVGADMIWMGMLVVMLLEIGLLTPPVGLNAFAVKTVVGDAVPLSTILRGLIWFIAVDVIVVALLIAFPEISLYLPGKLE